MSKKSRKKRKYRKLRERLIAIRAARRLLGCYGGIVTRQFLIHDEWVMCNTDEKT